MARRTFEKRSRAQNQEPITRMRDQFFGETSDMPGAAIDKKFQLSLVNQVCYGSFVKSRDGITDRQDDNMGLPPLFGANPGSYYTISSMSQLGTTVTVVGYSFTSADIGKFVCYDNKDGYFNGSNAAIYQTAKITDVGVGTANNTCTVDLPQTVTSRIGQFKYPLNGQWFNAYNQKNIVHVGTTLYQCSPGDYSWAAITQVGVSPIPNCKTIIRDNDNLVVLIPDNDPFGNSSPTNLYLGIWIIDTENNQYWKAAENNTAYPQYSVDAPLKNCTDAPITNGYNRRYLYTKSRFVGDSSNYPIFANRNISTENELQHESGAQQFGPTIKDPDYTLLGTATANGQLYGQLTFYPTISYFTPGSTYAFALAESGAAAKTILFNMSTITPVTIDTIRDSIAPGIISYFPDILVETNSNNSGVPIGAIRLTTTVNYLSYFTSPTVQPISGTNWLNGETGNPGALLSDNGAQTNGKLICYPSLSNFTPGGTYEFDLPVYVNTNTWSPKTGTNLGNHYAVCYGNGIYVAVGPGLIQTSTDGNSWTTRLSGTFSSILYAVAYYSYQGVQKFVAVGQGGVILISDSTGTTWTQKTSNTTRDLKGIAQGYAGKLVAVGGRDIATSADAGNTWAKTTINPCAIVYNGTNLYVIVGPSGLIQTSPDETTWYTQTSGTTKNINAIIWDGTNFVAVGDYGTIITSTNGTAWIIRSSGQISNLKSVAFANSTYVAVGDLATIVRSSDLVTWTGIVPFTPMDFTSITHYTGIWVAVGRNSTGYHVNIVFSKQSDASAWGGYTFLPQNYNLNSVTADSNGNITVVGDDGIIASVLASLIMGDDSVFQIRTSGVTANLNSVTNYTNILIAVGDSGKVTTSTNSTTWTPKTTNITDNLICVAYGNAKYIATTDKGIMYDSSDATTWTLKTTATIGGSFRGIVYTSQYVIVGDAGTVFTSADALTWTKRSLPIANNLLALTYGNSLYITVGSGGAIFTSDDAITWESQQSGITTDLFSIAYGNALFRASGNGGKIISSADGITWGAEVSGVTSDLNSIIFVNSASDFATIGFLISGSSTPVFLISGPQWDNVQIAFILSDQDPVTINSLIDSFASIITSRYPDITITQATDGTGAWIQAILIATTVHQLNYLTNSVVPDVSGAGRLNANSIANGALLVDLTTVAAKYFNDNLSPNTSGTACDPATHYSVYGTEDINTNDVLTVGNDPNAFALLDDIPIMKAFYGDGSTSGLQITSGTDIGTFTTKQGHFTTADVGRIMPIVWQWPYGTAFGYYLAWAKILSLVSGSTTSVNIQLTIDGVNPFTLFTFIDPSYCYDYLKAWATIESHWIFDCSLSGKTMTVNHIWSTNKSGINGTALQNYTLGSYAPYVLTPQVGEQCFLDYGDIRIVTTYDSTAQTITVDDNFATEAAACMAFRAMNWSYLDSYTDAEISPKIGNFGIKTRFMRAIPWDGSSRFCGEMLPGFLIASCNISYYYSELPNNYRYLIGDYDPNHQTDKVSEPITAFSSHSDAVGIFSLKSCHVVQTNLDIDFTDESNGMIVRVLPPPKIIGENNGCDGMDELCKIDAGLYAVILYKTADICLFDGNSFGDSLSLGKIRNKIFKLFERTIDYDPQYGLFVRGNDLSGLCYENNRFYYIILPGMFAIGQGEFNDLPLGEMGVHFINNKFSYLYNALIMSKTGDSVPVRAVPGEFFRFNYAAIDNSNMYDDYYYTLCIMAPITSTHITSDDTGTSQAFFIEQMESHIFLNPDKSNIDPVGGVSFIDSVPGSSYPVTPLTIAMTAQNDIGQTVTVSSMVGNNDDINFDLKVRGHRIRYSITFNGAGWQMTGLLSYYKSSDKRTPTNSGDTEHTSQAVILSPVAGIGRTSQLLSLASGNVLQGMTTLGVGALSTIARILGPDGNTYSAYVNIGQVGLCIPSIIDMTNHAFAIGFWYNPAAATSANGIVIESLFLPYQSTISIDGVTGKLIAHDPADPDDSVTIPTSGWHYLLIQYNNGTNSSQVSVDLGAPVVFSAIGRFNTQIETGFIFMPHCLHSIFDLRVFNLNGAAYPMLESTLTYYYNDVLAGGNRTLSQA